MLLGDGAQEAHMVSRTLQVCGRGCGRLPAELTPPVGGKELARESVATLHGVAGDAPLPCVKDADAGTSCGGPNGTKEHRGVVAHGWAARASGGF